jgi:hypothetical protein
MSRRDKALTADDLEEQLIDVPEWDIDVLLRGMTGKQRINLVDRSKPADRQYMYADILILTALEPEPDDAGVNQPIFDKADRDALSEKSGAVLERLGMIVMNELSGISVDDAEDEVEADPTSDGA